ncbi:MFS transporter [Streptosporangium sp. KLBMP 9127]|nr:MFS transporter [Streptosporangium sp. KLBMP 9127]
MKHILQNSAGVRPLRRQRDYRLFWSARTISLGGSEVSRLAVPLTAVTLLGASPFQMGLLAAAASLPTLLIGLQAGAIADRLTRRRPVMIACELVSAAAALTVPLAWVTDLLTIPWLITVAFVIGSCAVIYKSADFPYITTVVPEGQRTEAMAGFQASHSIAVVGGPGLAGVLVQALTAPFAVLVEALSFLVSALLLRSIRATEHHTPAPSRGIWRDIGQGVRITVSRPALRAISGAGVTHNFFAGTCLAVYLLFALNELRLPPAVLGVLTACFGIGGLLGAAVVPRAARRFTEERVLLYSVLLLPLDFVTMALVSGSLLTKAVLMFASALATGATIVAFATSMNAITLRESPADSLGRVRATTTFAIQGVLTLGGLTGGLLGELLGLRPVLWICAAGALLSIPWIWLSPLRHPTPA